MDTTSAGPSTSQNSTLIAKIFALADRDHDGFLSRYEVNKFAEAIGDDEQMSAGDFGDFCEVLGADQQVGLSLENFQILYGEEPYAGNEKKHLAALEGTNVSRPSNSGGGGGGGSSSSSSSGTATEVADTLEVGTAVEADYAGKGNYYPGKINRVNGEGGDPGDISYDILYDDGDRERGVPRSRIKVPGSGGGTSAPKQAEGNDLLEVGTAVEADYAGKGNYYPGKINRVNGEGGDPGDISYDILYDDGDRERGVPRSRIKISGSGGGTSASTQSGGNDLLEVGTAVEADYAGKGNYYPGKINRVNGEGGDPGDISYDILYDDGDRERGVPRSRIKVRGESTPQNSEAAGDTLQEGTPVEADYAGKGNYYPGKISRVNNADDPSSISYDILYDDGDRERGLPRSRIRLK